MPSVLSSTASYDYGYPAKVITGAYDKSYFFEDLLGFKLDLFPGVLLLSRRRLSSFPVDLAIGFGPGLSAMVVLLEFRE